MENNKYDDIINLSRPKSKYPKSTMDQRAGQFMPFAALKGYEEGIEVINSYVEEKKILSDEQKNDLDLALSNLNNGDEIKVTYFKKHSSKQDGNYITDTLIFKEVDPINRLIKFIGTPDIKIEDIYLID